MDRFVGRLSRSLKNSGLRHKSDIKKRCCKNSVDTVDLGSGQITVKEGRDGLAKVRDLIILVIR